jgi:hypothetical protein
LTQAFFNANFLNLIDDWIKRRAKGVRLLIGLGLELYEALTLYLYIENPSVLVWVKHKPVAH